MASPDLTAWTQTARCLTETAARACAPWTGSGNKDAADRAAVEAVRKEARAHDLHGRIVIGEGEKDDAPYLEPGTVLGPDTDPVLDVAVDPLEGTSLVAQDESGALSVLALAPAETLLPLGRAFYMEKLIGPPGLDNSLSLDASPRAVVEAVSKVLGIPPSAVRVAVQDRPRHAELIEDLRAAGATVYLFGEGDLSFALLALQSRRTPSTGSKDGTPPIDLLWSIGGAPEGMLAAAAQRVLGGSMRARLAPQSEAERSRLGNDSTLPAVLDRSFTSNELVQTNAVTISLTGVTDGPLLAGFRSRNGVQQTETLLLSPDRPPQRTLTSHEAAS